MRVTKKIPVAAIKMDRHPLNQSMIGLLDHMRSGGSVPPIHVARMPSGRYLIKDGRHRVTAHKLLGIKTITAKYHTHG